MTSRYLRKTLTLPDTILPGLAVDQLTEAQRADVTDWVDSLTGEVAWDRRVVLLAALTPAASGAGSTLSWQPHEADTAALGPVDERGAQPSPSSLSRRSRCPLPKCSSTARIAPTPRSPPGGCSPDLRDIRHVRHRL
ncbi:hypothetical protein AB1285_26705 [Microbacterium sp. NRRL B-14842]|uniref:hypothetical protein n=1 Tax=Microbacterium sp. NRRL B-14842 TaxID=3162881 RepID=UPI003D2AAC6C